jgi:hypothetical protein
MRPQLTDAELVRRFEDGSLPNAEFGHVEHVRLALLYVRSYGPSGALERLADGLLRFATRAGHPEKFSYGLTAAWVQAIDAARRGQPDAVTFEALTAACPSLLDRTSVRAPGAPL